MADTTTPLYGLVQPEVGASTDTWGGKENTDLLQIEQEIARLRIPFISPTYNVGGTTTLDLNQASGARVFQFTVSGASTIAFSNVPSASWFARVLVKITNGAAFAITWPAAVVWQGGLAPVFSNPGVDWVELFTLDGGVTWYGQGVHLKTTTLSALNVKNLWSPAPATTTSAVEVSLASKAMIANQLSANGDTVRITVQGVVLNCCPGFTVKLKFGSVTIATLTPAAAFGTFAIKARIVRSALNQQIAYVETATGDGLSLPTRFTSTETETNPITIDVRGSISSGQTLRVDDISMEFIGALP